MIVFTSFCSADTSSTDRTKSAERMSRVTLHRHTLIKMRGTLWQVIQRRVQVVCNR